MKTNEVALQLLQIWLNRNSSKVSPKYIAQAYVFFHTVASTGNIPEDIIEDGNEDC